MFKIYDKGESFEDSIPRMPYLSLIKLTNKVSKSIGLFPTLQMILILH